MAFMPSVSLVTSHHDSIQSNSGVKVQNLTRDISILHKLNQNNSCVTWQMLRMTASLSILGQAIRLRTLGVSIVHWMQI